MLLRDVPACSRRYHQGCKRKAFAPGLAKLGGGLLLALLLGACGETAKLQESASIGPRPQLPAPTQTLLPTVHIAPASAWPPGASPVAAAGTRVSRFAEGLDHPRWLYLLPNGDLLVAESNAPPKPPEVLAQQGLFTKLSHWVMGKVMQRAGAGVPSANRISLLRDADGDGLAELRSPFLEGLNSPFGMVLVGKTLYVANADAVVAFPYETGQTQINSPGTRLTELPAGLNHHWTKNLLASRDGSKLYATVGSNSNIGENGMAIEAGRAAVWEIDLASGNKRLFASGLRNPNGMAWTPDGALWTVVNERDMLGSDLVPDYLTTVVDGAFYGWPYSYFGQHVDSRVQPQDPAKVASARVPDYALGNHVAPLGLAWAEGNRLGPPFANGMFVGLHGSWNRKPRSGYKVVFVPFQGNQPTGQPLDVLTGFVDGEGRAMGRPVGVVLDNKGALLVADDVGNIVWRLTGAAN